MCVYVYFYPFIYSNMAGNIHKTPYTKCIDMLFEAKQIQKHQRHPQDLFRHGLRKPIAHV